MQQNIKHNRHTAGGGGRTGEYWTNKNDFFFMYDGSVSLHVCMVDTTNKGLFFLSELGTTSCRNAYILPYMIRPPTHVAPATLAPYSAQGLTTNHIPGALEYLAYCLYLLFTRSPKRHNQPRRVCVYLGYAVVEIFSQEK